MPQPKNIQQFSPRSAKGFTLIEIVCVVVVMGILGAIGLSFMKDTSTTGRENAGMSVAIELNSAFQNLRAASASFSTGAASLVTGGATSPAIITLPSAPTTADMEVIFDALTSGTGIRSYGNTCTLTHRPTPSSYTYTLDTATSFPTFTFNTNTGATP